MTVDAALIRVSPWLPRRQNAKYDLFVAAVGYESRSRYVSTKLSPVASSRVAACFAVQQELSFRDNERWFSKAGFQITVVSDEQYRTWVATLLEECLTSTAREHIVRIGIDVSSLSRSRIAAWFEGILSVPAERDVVFEFSYALARYTPPATTEAPNSHVGPVTPAFAGWFTEPDLGLTAILGLGYEQDKGLGAVEHLQPSEVWTFLPDSGIVAYEKALSRANHTLLETIPSSHQLTYRVKYPYEAFVALESLCHRTSSISNTVLFPFGPKIFAVNALAVALLHRDIAVWRVSPGVAEEPRDRVPNGSVCGLRVEVLTRDGLPGRLA